MINDELKRLRLEKGITQVQLAEALGVSQSTIASCENGKRRPDLEFLLTIAHFYGVSVSELYGSEDAQRTIDDEAWAIRERLRRDPSYRLLFSAADSATPEHLRAAGHPVRFRTHDLRHTYCTMLRDAGIDMHQAMIWLGHSDEKMILRVYDHITEKRTAQSVKIANKYAERSQNGSQSSASPPESLSP